MRKKADFVFSFIISLSGFGCLAYLVFYSPWDVLSTPSQTNNFASQETKVKEPISENIEREEKAPDDKTSRSDSINDSPQKNVLNENIEKEHSDKEEENTKDLLKEDGSDNELNKENIKPPKSYTRPQGGRYVRIPGIEMDPLKGTKYEKTRVIPVPPADWIIK